MDAKTETLLINTALKVAVDATGLVPGLSQAHAILQIAADVAPAVEEAVAYFESPEGQTAIAHMNALFGALSASAGQHISFAAPKIHEKNATYVWDPFQGWVLA